MATLALDRVVKRYGDQPVIHGVDLQVESGEFCVLVGPSGCGKSTLLRMIAGLEAISDGTVSIDGQRVNELSAAQRGLAMVFQSYALYPHMTVRQNLAFGLENLRTPRPEIDRRVQQAAQMLQIEPLLQRRPRQLSGGQRQRVAIGRAVVREPRIFLFDEPLSNLDAELRVQTRGEIKALHRRLGSTMIYVTHDQVEAMTMADRICVLRDGKVAQVGRPLDLYNRPASRFVGGFIGSPRMNFLDGRIAAIDGAGIDVAIDGLPMLRLPVDGKSARVEQKVILGVRPEHVRRAEGTGGFVATVNVAEHLGSDSYLFCTLPGGQSLNIHRPGQELIQPDERVTLMLDPDLCHVFEHDGAQAAMPRLRP